MKLFGGPDANRLFGTASYGVPVPLRRAPNPRIIWVNRRILYDDPVFRDQAMSVEQYCDRLIADCAYIVADKSDAVDSGCVTAMGLADRYGGGGLAGNGGSGRTVLVNGYLVKGVGRTPLIGIDGDKDHTSGGAYLEEAVRETIFSEVVAAEFPHSAVGTIAIIDTGLSVQWDTKDGPKRERRVLLVRPAVVRPAHFERAIGFVSNNALDGLNDLERVRSVISRCESLLGHAAMLTMINEFWLRWAEQLGYSVAHRLTQGGNFSSNISIDGRLLDFGTASALPSWATIVVLDGANLFGHDMNSLTQAIESTSYNLGRHFDPNLGLPAWRKAVLRRSYEAYWRTFFVEALRLCGLGRRRAEALAAGNLARTIERYLKQAFAHFRSESFDVLVSTPTPRIAWDLADIWGTPAPEYLRALSLCLKAELPQSLWAEADSRAQFFSQPRAILYREEAKLWIYNAVERGARDGDHFNSDVARVICKATAAGRRDGHIDIDGVIPVGFAVGEQIICSLQRDRLTGSSLAHIEWLESNDLHVGSRDRLGFDDVSRGALYRVRRWQDDNIEFEDERIGCVACAVSVSGHV
jgi:hypothetical protein